MAERTTTSSATPDAAAMAGRHELPEPPEELIGRETELQTLLAHVGAAPVVIHSGNQPPGIGKTALALALAHRMKAYYSDAQFHVDLRGDSDRPLCSGDALACLIQCLLPGAIPPDDPGELRMHYHSAFAGKRALILLTNAANAAQVLPLVPPEPCALVITSRNQLDLPDAFSLELGPLAEADATDLLLRLAPRIGPAVSQLAALCGGVPMALCAAGGLLGVRDDLIPQEYVRGLGERATGARTEAADLVLGLNHGPDAVRAREALACPVGLPGRL